LAARRGQENSCEQRPSIKTSMSFCGMMTRSAPYQQIDSSCDGFVILDRLLSCIAA
jgi:hypothetical protein